MTSTATKKYRTWLVVITIISFLLNIGPLATYVVIGLCSSTLLIEKVALCSTVFVVLILTVVAAINKLVMRSRVWVLLLGLYLCLDYFIVPLVIIAVCQVLDELVFHPLRKHYKTKLTINKEIDKRL